jgi:hypothetical protein
MASKTQAKAAIDAVVVSIKAEIDNILPVGVNIKDGVINFAPPRWSIQMDAGGSSSTAESWITSITSALTSASRAFVVKRAGRRADDSTGDGYRIETTLAIYTILNTH